MNSILDYNVFNTINPDALAPKEPKHRPFPLENFDEEVASAYQKIELILRKLEAATHNPANDTPAKKKRLKSLRYKTRTCMQLLREISTACDDIWY
jgi:hypothetical protein